MNFKSCKSANISVNRAYQILCLLILTGFIFSGLLKSYPELESLNSSIDLTILLGCGVMFFSFFKLISRQPIKISIHVKMFTLFLIMFYMYCLFSYSFLSHQDNNSTKKILQLSIGVVFVFCCIVLIDTPGKVKSFLMLTFLLGIFTNFLEIAHMGSRLSMQITSEDNYQWVSRISLFGFVIAIVLFLEAHSMYSKVVIGFLLLFIVVGMVVAGARQTVVALAVAIFYLGWVQIFRDSNRWLTLQKVLKYSASVAFFCVLFYVAYNQISWISDSRGLQRTIKFAELVLTNNLEAAYLISNRAVPFRDGWYMFLDFPILGVGFGDFSQHASTAQYSHPHNIFLEILSELGIIGLLLFLLVLSPSVYMIMRIKIVCSSLICTATALLFISHFAVSMMSGDLGTNRVFYCFLAIFLLSTQAHEVGKLSWGTQKNRSYLWKVSQKYEYSTYENMRSS